MHLATDTVRPRDADAALQALGSEHPMVRAEERVRRLRAQAGAVGAILALGGAGLLAGVRDLAPLVLAAAIVLAPLAAGLCLALIARRDAALDLVAAGRDGLPLPAVRRMRARLSDPRRARALARSLRSLRREARRSWHGLLPPLWSPSVIREVDEELERIAQLLETQPSVRLVACAEQLLGGGGSPLYGGDPLRLREELRRIRFVA